MDYSTDKPIENVSQDLLGRGHFSEQLGKSIYQHNGEDGLVIGLFGKWGTGKTSVVNMVLSEIERVSQFDENKPLILRFSPWNYSGKDNLISLFFRSLKNKIKIQGNDELKKKVGRALNDYAVTFEVLSVAPGVGSQVARILKVIFKTLADKLMQEPDLYKTKEILENALREAKKKIIIVIDDIDRLSNLQIKEIFQLVKQVADFPNVIYILTMDREVVRRALT